MRFWLSMLVSVLLTLFLPFAARAQPALTLDKVQVAIWPEYDKPDVLVIYHVSLSSQASLPADVNIRIPKEAGKPNAVAMQNVDGSLVNLTFNTTEEGVWNRVTFTTTVPAFQLEYYDPRLTKEGAKRSFEYRWAGDYSVTAMSVQVQQPVWASQMQIVPNMGSGQQQQDGLKYYDTSVGEIKAGTGFTIQLSYIKNDTNLSVNASSPVQPAAPINQSTTGRQTIQGALPWVLGLIGMLMIVGGGLWYWQSGRERRPAAEIKRRHVAAARPRDAAEAEGSGAVYCHQCGHRANQGDAFCRTCGAKLRS